MPNMINKKVINGKNGEYKPRFKLFDILGFAILVSTPLFSILA